MPIKYASPRGNWPPMRSLCFQDPCSVGLGECLINTVLLSRLVPPAPYREAENDCSDPERGTRAKCASPKGSGSRFHFCAFRVFAQAEVFAHLGKHGSLMNDKTSPCSVVHRGKHRPFTGIPGTPGRPLLRLLSLAGDRLNLFDRLCDRSQILRCPHQHRLGQPNHCLVTSTFCRRT